MTPPRDDETSIRYFTRIVTAMPDNAAAWYNLANAEYRMGRYAVSFEKAQRCSTDQIPVAVRAPCLMLAGSSLARMGRTSEAMAYLRQARTLDPAIR